MEPGRSHELGIHPQGRIAVPRLRHLSGTAVPGRGLRRAWYERFLPVPGSDFLGAARRIYGVRTPRLRALAARAGGGDPRRECRQLKLRLSERFSTFSKTPSSEAAAFRQILHVFKYPQAKLRLSDRFSTFSKTRAGWSPMREYSCFRAISSSFWSRSAAATFPSFPGDWRTGRPAAG